VRIAPAAVDPTRGHPQSRTRVASHVPPCQARVGRFMYVALSFLLERPLGEQWTPALSTRQNGVMRPVDPDPTLFRV
jgi:hypothetical protein